MTDEAYLIYRPAMDEFSREKLHLVCLDEEQAYAIREEMVEFADNLIREVNESDTVQDLPSMDIEWPYGIDLSSDLPFLRFANYESDFFDPDRIAVRAIPMN